MPGPFGDLDAYSTESEEGNDEPELSSEEDARDPVDFATLSATEFEALIQAVKAGAFVDADIAMESLVLVTPVQRPFAAGRGETQPGDREASPVRPHVGRPRRSTLEDGDRSTLDVNLQAHEVSNARRDPLGAVPPNPRQIEFGDKLRLFGHDRGVPGRSLGSGATATHRRRLPVGSLHPHVRLLSGAPLQPVALHDQCVRPQITEARRSVAPPGRLRHARQDGRAVRFRSRTRWQPL